MKYAHLRIGSRRILALTVCAILLFQAACAFWSERTADVVESRYFQAELDAVFEAIREEVEDRDFRVRHESARNGALTALSWARTESTFRSASQTELRFKLEDGAPGEVEVFLEISEIEEREITRDQPMVSRRPVRDRNLYRILLDGIEERLADR